jgi:hypothetical protein
VQLPAPAAPRAAAAAGGAAAVQSKGKKTGWIGIGEGNNTKKKF